MLSAFLKVKVSVVCLLLLLPNIVGAQAVAADKAAKPQQPAGPYRTQAKLPFSPDGRSQKKKPEVKLPDLKPEEPLITVNGSSITWGAVRAHAELLVSEIRIPKGVTVEDFEEERDNFMLKRIYTVGHQFAVKTLFAQEALRRGITLKPTEVEAKREEIYARVRKQRSTKAERYLKTFNEPGSFFQIDLTNSLLMAHLEQDILKPAIKVDDLAITAAIAERKDENLKREKKNSELRPRLEKMRKELLDGTLKFEDTAFSESDCDSSYEYGLVGTRAVKDLLPELVATLTNLTPEVLSEVVETPYSYHLLKLHKLNRGFPKEGSSEEPPVVSINFSHIMLEKKESLPELSKAELVEKIVAEKLAEQMEELEARLLKAAEVKTTLNVGL